LAWGERIDEYRVLRKIQGREDAENAEAGGVVAKADIRGQQGGARDRQVRGGWIGGILGKYVGTPDVAVGSEKQATTTELIVVLGKKQLMACENNGQQQKRD
jgi:hypothetical protein